MSVKGWLLGVHLRPLSGKRLVVNLFWFIYDDMAASIREPERNAKKVLEPHSQRFPSLRWNEKQHETAAARSEELAPKGAGAAPCLINLIKVGVSDVSRQRSFHLPAFVQQMAKFI